MCLLVTDNYWREILVLLLEKEKNLTTIILELTFIENLCNLCKYKLQNY